jgi:hypothetical protein
LNLYEKIIEVRKCIAGFNKDKKSFGYDYVSGNQVLGKVKEKMDELGLILSPSCHSCNHEEFHYSVTKYDKDTKQKETTDKTDFVVWGEMRYTWIDASKPEERFCESWQYYGQQDDISKAFGSALTYSERYYLLKFFGVPTDKDDPDSNDTRNKQGKKPPFTMSFGMHKGKTFDEINDDAYIQRLLKCEDPKTKEAAQKYLNFKNANAGFQGALDGVKK